MIMNGAHVVVRGVVARRSRRSCLNLIAIDDAVTSPRDSVGNKRSIGPGAIILAISLENHACAARVASPQLRERRYRVDTKARAAGVR